MYYLCEKYEPITVPYYTANCVSWVPRLTMLELCTDSTYKHALEMKLVHIQGTYCTFSHYTQINSKWTEDLNEIPETIKLPEENIDSTLLCDISLQNFLDLSPYVREIKAKTEMGMGNEKKIEMGVHQAKKILQSKGNNKTKSLLNGKRQLQIMSNEGLISKTYKNIKKLNNLIKKVGIDIFLEKTYRWPRHT